MHPTVRDAAGIARSATGSAWKVATPVVAPAPAFETRILLDFAVPSPTSRVEVDPVATTFSGAFGPVEAAVPQSALRSAGSPSAVIVELPAPREVRRLVLSQSKTLDAGAAYSVALHRLDGEVLAPQATVTGAVSNRSASFPPGFAAARFAVVLRRGDARVGLAKADVSALDVRSYPTTPRIGVAAHAHPPDVFFAILPGELRDAGAGAVDAGAALAAHLQRVFDAAAGPAPARLAIVVQSDAPCELALSDFAVAARFVSETFAYGALVADDVADPRALVAALRDGGDPVAAFLRDGLSPSSRRRVIEGADPDEGFVSALADELGAVVRDGALYAADRFAHVELSEETQARLDPAATGSARAALNRLLLQDAFPGTLLAPDRKRVLRFPGAAAPERTLLVELPPSAKPVSAVLATEENVRADRPLSAGEEASEPAPGAAAGVHVPPNGSVAALFERHESAAVSGIAVGVLGLAPATRLALEVQEDWLGEPSGRTVAAGTLAPRAGDALLATVFVDEPVLLATGRYWLVLRSETGHAVWLAEPAAGEARAVRRENGRWTPQHALAGLRPVLSLLARTRGAAHVPGAALTVGGARVAAAERDDGPATYEISGALAAAVAGAPSGAEVRVPLVLSASAPGTITVRPPRIVYDV